MRILGLDLGSKRIGLAVSDELGLIATPHGVILRQSYNKDTARIAALVQDLRAERVVIGLPLGLSGVRTQQTVRAQRFGEILAERVPVTVEWWDERLTTVTAQAMSKTGATKPRARQSYRPQVRDQRGRVDEIAAAVMLQGFLDYRRRPSTR